MNQLVILIKMCGDCKPINTLLNSDSDIDPSYQSAAFAENHPEYESQNADADADAPVPKKRKYTMKPPSYERSFASDPKSKYWSDENVLKAKDVYKSSNEIYKFKCDKCPHSFEMNPNHVTNQDQWCGFCSNKQLCKAEDCQVCKDKSFASHPKHVHWSETKNGDLRARDVFKSSNKKGWFDCIICGHEFEIRLNDVTQHDQGCGFCANKQLCDVAACKICTDKSFASNIERKACWSLKNGDIKPRDVFKACAKKFHFDCEICHKTFYTSLNHVHAGKWCPHCQNKTELRMFNFLETIYSDQLVWQYKVEWCKNIQCLPFDFCLLQLGIIIELDGSQHFEQVRNWRPPEEQFIVDVYKEQCANDNGYSTIRIVQEDVWKNKYDWQQELIAAIDEIVKNGEVVNVYMCKNNEYQNYL
jgi:very-short-patch-repair endonuclease